MLKCKKCNSTNVIEELGLCFKCTEKYQPDRLSKVNTYDAQAFKDTRKRERYRLGYGGLGLSNGYRKLSTYEQLMAAPMRPSVMLINEAELADIKKCCFFDEVSVSDGRFDHKTVSSKTSIGFSNTLWHDYQLEGAVQTLSRVTLKKETNGYSWTTAADHEGQADYMDED